MAGEASCICYLEEGMMLLGREEGRSLHRSELQIQAIHWEELVTHDPPHPHETETSRPTPTPPRPGPIYLL